MPFKEGVTNNIYTSWFETIHFSMIRSGIPNWRGLGDFTLEELNHLKWLIEQEINYRKNK